MLVIWLSVIILSAVGVGILIGVHIKSRNDKKIVSLLQSQTKIQMLIAQHLGVLPENIVGIFENDDKCSKTH